MGLAHVPVIAAAQCIEMKTIDIYINLRLEAKLYELREELEEEGKTEEEVEKELDKLRKRLQSSMVRDDECGLFD